MFIFVDKTIQMNFNFKKLTPHLIAVLVILFSSILYFFPQLSGKAVKSGDLVQVVGMAKESSDHYKKTGEAALWTNSMFGGMPLYQIHMVKSSPVLGYVFKALQLGFERPIGLFIMGMLLFYLTMIAMGVSTWLSLIGALLFGFTTNNVVLFEAGHSSKLGVIMTSAPVLGGIILTYGKKYWQGLTLFTFAMAFNIYCNHIQMSYYLALITLPLVLFYFINSILKKEIVSFFKSSVFLLLGLVLAAASCAGKLWTTYEYGQETMRGKPILTAAANAEKSSSSVEGLEYGYAMSWSNGVGDLLASYIPRVVGGGSQESVSSDSDFAKKTGQRKNVKAPTYFGALPFTSGPIYFGAIAFFLFVFSLFSMKNAFKWWALFAVLFTFMLSMGKYIGLNEWIFNNIPLYNKFRTPNSILSITAVIIPLIGILGLNNFIKSEDKSSFLKPLYYTIGLLGGIALLVMLMGGSLMSFETENDKQYGELASTVVEMRESMMFSSAFGTLMLLLIATGILWMNIKGKISTTITIALIGVIGVLDLIVVDKRYVSNDDFVKNTFFGKEREPRPVDAQILKDTDPNYRVYDATINTFNSSEASYFHKTIGGYHAAKLQRIQDIIDRHISKNNMKVLDMLNTKYFIVPNNETPVVQQNPNAAGNAWFVKNVQLVDNANAEIDSLNSFNVKGTAIVHKEFADYVKGISPADSTSKIVLTSYSPNKLEYKSSSKNGEGLAVFSEVWYGPNKGWEASIDGKKMDFVRADYILRAMKIPQGDHTITFEFKPKSYFLGETISMVVSLLLIALTIFGLYKSAKEEDVLINA